MALASKTEGTYFCSVYPSSSGILDLACLLKYGTGARREGDQPAARGLPKPLLLYILFANVLLAKGRCGLCSGGWHLKVTWQKVWSQERGRVERVLQSDHPRPSVRIAG